MEARATYVHLTIRLTKSVIFKCLALEFSGGLDFSFSSVQAFLMF